jgi:hypothetical protein
MTLEYKINEQDFLDFQLFTASKSDRINKKKRNGWILLTLGSIVIAFYFFLSENIAMTIYFGLVAIVCGLFYPKYFKWRYKKHYKTYIQENYSKRFGQIEYLEINSDYIFSKDKTGEGKINLSEIERVDETDNHFFLKISTGMSLLIPKSELGNIDKLREKFKEIGLIINDETKWSWK